AGSLPTGLSLNAGSGVISGTPTTVATTNFTVTATDSTSPTAQTAAKALSITVSASGLVITTTSLPSGVVTSNYNQTLQSSGGTNPVTWTITTGTLPAGLTLNAATGSISGTPTTTGMSAFTVKATDSTAPTAQTATANLSITVNTAACGTGGSLTLLKGQYAFAMEGFDGVNPEGIAGVFDADGAGHIAQNVGIYDINDASSFGVHLGFSISSATSSYTIGPDGRGCLVIGLTGGGGTTFRFSLGNITGTPPVASTGHIMQFDNNVTEFKVGILRKQDPTAFSNVQISGNYAFGGTGAKPNSGKYAIAGTFTASGTPSGAITAGQMDTNDNGNVNNTGAAFTYPPTPIAFTGSYNIAAGPSGRGTLTISTGTSTINANVYVVSASELLMLSTDVQTANPLLVGLALQTTQSTFATNSLNAPGIVYTTGLGYNGTTVVSLVSGAIFSPNSFTYNGYQNSGGSISATAPLAGITYSVAANGRVTLVGSSGGYAPIFYLVSPNKGFVLFTDNSLTNPRVESGFMDPQTGGPFTNSSANGTYAFGTMWPSVVSVTQNTGVATFTAPNINATSDAASPVGRSPNATFTSTYSVDPTGLGVIPAGCSILGGTCQTIFYVISPTKAVVFTVQPTNTNPDLQIADK
ncbi:MAG TPA: Ig domain-containing protein, partial [Candidatus Dormibacteraeota bacterium]|nr:Ig domain-containing protein [Candidatus Dormibacteraeota bacterium]